MTISGVRERFFAKVDKVSSRAGCWLWIGSTNRPREAGFAYGQFRYMGRMRLAHRVSLMLEGFKIPPGMFVCHRCDTPLCVNPAHLFVGTQSDNMQDCLQKGRQGRCYGDEHWSRKMPERRARGVGHGSAKLSNVDIGKLLAKRASGRTQRQLAAMFEISQRQVGRICRGENWTHITAAEVERLLEEINNG